jgi:hypothetical protein
MSFVRLTPIFVGKTDAFPSHLQLEPLRSSFHRPGFVLLDVQKGLEGGTFFCCGLRYVDLYLVGGLEHFLFFHILGIIIPTDKYFSDGLKPPTRYCVFSN